MNRAVCHPDKPKYAFNLCRACYRKQRRDSRIEEFREKEKQWYENNKAKVIANQRKYYEKKRAEGAYSTDEFKERKRQYNAQPHVKERVKEYDRRKHLAKFGMSIEDYYTLLADQDGVCAICHTGNPGRDDRELLYVDHDHTTGYIRGLLCHNCNFGIGHFKDSPSLLEEAARYLREHLSR